MRYVATFRNPTVVSDAAGGTYNSGYNDVLTTRCQLIKDSGQEVLSTGQVFYNGTYTMRCGYRPAIGINSDTLVHISGPGLPVATFKINDAVRVDMINHLYEFKLIAANVN
jgi:hypothetical protein